MPSVRDTLDCIGRDTSGDNSVLRDLFGFRLRRVPFTGSGRFSVSLKDTLDGLQGRHVHLNVINVGWVNEFSDSDRETGRRKVDFAIMRTRQIYEQVNLGVGRVQHWVIDQDDADGADDLDSQAEGNGLSDDWSVDNDGIDCFVVRTISDSSYVGLAPVPGDCDKGGKGDGLIAGAIDRGGSVGVWFDRFARTFAHEVGHYLGLPHNHGNTCPADDSRNNLMAQTRCITDAARDAVDLTGSQGTTMRAHCMTHSGC